MLAIVRLVVPPPFISASSDRYYGSGASRFMTTRRGEALQSNFSFSQRDAVRVTLAPASTPAKVNILATFFMATLHGCSAGWDVRMSRCRRKGEVHSVILLSVRQNDCLWHDPEVLSDAF